MTERPVPPLLIIEKGEPDETELAALALVLRTRSRKPAGCARLIRASASWRRPERLISFESPRSWHRSAR